MLLTEYSSYPIIKIHWISSNLSNLDYICCQNQYFAVVLKRKGELYALAVQKSFEYNTFKSCAH